MQHVTVDGTLPTFAWDWATGVPELLTDDDKRYLVGYDTLGWTDASGWAYAVPDALGSVRQAVDGSGAVIGAREWSPYGVEAGEAQEGLGYTGEWWDGAVGLQYLRARWYDVQSGRFTATDPWEGSRQQPSTLNRYAYVVGNPVNLVDPTGLYAVADILALGCGSKPCTVHPIIEYIIGKIQADAASREIQEIYELNQARYYADAWVACQRMPWWQRLFFCPEHLQTAAGMDTASRIQALAQFGCLVADGRTRPVCGQWGYKVEIGGDRDLGQNAQTINFCSIGVKEEVVFFYDIWANVHFGYLGMTGGIRAGYAANRCDSREHGLQSWRGHGRLVRPDMHRHWHTPVRDRAN